MSIVGRGEQHELITTYVTEHDLDNVHFLGFINQSDMPKFFAMSDIFVLPSENEPWGLIINEAMCGRLAIVASEEIGAVADLVHHDVNGFLYSLGNVQVLTNYLIELCIDQELCQSMGGCSLEIIAG